MGGGKFIQVSVDSRHANICRAQTRGQIIQYTKKEYLVRSSGNPKKSNIWKELLWYNTIHISDTSTYESITYHTI